MFKLGIVSLIFLIALMIVPINFVSAQSGNLYVDNDYGFKIKYPQGWEVTENPVFGTGGSGIVAFMDTSSNSKYRPNFHIMYDKDSEILIKAGTEVAENLEVNLLVSAASYEDSDSDTDRVQVMATYSF